MTASTGTQTLQVQEKSQLNKARVTPSFLSESGNVIAKDTTILLAATGAVFLLLQLSILWYYESLAPNEVAIPGTNHKWDGGMQRILPESKSCADRPQLRSTAFDKGTSHVKWCEGKYEVTEYVAEFYNTFSNIPFFALPPLAAYLSWDYSVTIDAGINIVWGLLVVVGAGSGYFHATLSLSGQLFDEWAIIWVVMTGLALWTPPDLYRHRYDRGLHSLLGRKPSTSDRRTAFKLTVFVAAVLLTSLTMVYPVANAFVLLSFILPTLRILRYEYQYHAISTCTDPRTCAVANLAKSGLWWLLAALVCWLNDRLFCRWWKSLPIPYPQLHAVWHVFVLIAAYTICIVASWTYAERVVPKCRPEISYWPFRRFGIPFVKIDVKGTVQVDSK